VDLCCFHKECLRYIRWLRLVLYNVMLCILSDHHQGIYIYAAFMFQFDKVCIGSYVVGYSVKISEPSLFTSCFVSVVLV